MPGFQYFVASSLDGFIATADDQLDWLLQFDGFAGGKDSYDAFMADVGCIVMGGDTYAWLRKHEPGTWPYPETPCWVFTHHELTVVPGAQVEFTSADVAAVHAQMVDAAAGRDVWIVIRSLLPGRSTSIELTPAALRRSRRASFRSKSSFNSFA